LLSEVSEGEQCKSIKVKQWDLGYKCIQSMAQILVKLLINKKQHNNPKDRSQWSLFFPSVLTLTRTWPIYNKGTPIFLISLNRKQIQENKTRPTHFPLRSKYKQARVTDP
jgi:hypothetical protein